MSGLKNWCCGRNCSVDIGGRPVLKLSDDDTGEGEAEREDEYRQEEKYVYRTQEVSLHANAVREGEVGTWV